MGSALRAMARPCRMSLRHPGRPRKRAAISFLVVLVVGFAVAGIVSVLQNGSGTTTTSTSSSVVSPAPVGAGQLDGLLLDAAAVNVAMQTSGMTVTTTNNMWSSPTFSDNNCVGLEQPAASTVYSGAHWSAMAGQSLINPG